MINTILLLLLLVCFSAYTYLLGIRILRLFRIELIHYSETVVLSVAMGMGFLVSMLFFLGLLGLFYAWFIRLCFFVSLLILVYLDGRKEFCKARGIARSLSLHKPIFFWLLFSITLAYALFNLLRCLTPVTNADSIYVYLSHAKLFVQNHAIYNINYGGISASYRPLNALILNSLGILLYSDILSQLISGWYMGVLCAAAVYVIARNFVNRQVAFVVAAMFYTIPTLSWLIYSTKIDLSYTFFELSFWTVFVSWIKSKQNKYLYIGAMFLGFAVGTKYHALIALAYGTIAGLVIILANREGLLKAVKTMFLFSLLVLAVGSPSYIRSYILSGDPVHPFLTKTNTSRMLIMNHAEAAVKDSFGDFQFNVIFGRDYALNPRPMPDKPMSFLPFFFLPFLLLNKSTFRSHGKYILIFATYYLLLSYFVFITSESFPRHFLPAIGLLTVLSGIGLFSLIKITGRQLVYGCLSLIMISIIVFRIVGYGPSSLHQMQLQGKYISGKLSSDEYLSQTLYRYHWHMDYNMIQHIKDMSSNSKIWALDEAAGYYVDKPVIQKRGTNYCPDIASLMKSLQDERVTHVYYSTSRLLVNDDKLGTNFYEVIQDGVDGKYFVPEFQSDSQYLYKIVSD